MLVVMDCPEDIEGRLSELRGIAAKHKVEKVYLARVSRPFGSRVRSIVAPHRLDMAVQMSDAAANKHLFRMADILGRSGVKAEPISTGILATDLEEFINKNNFDIIVSIERLSKLYRRLESFAGKLVQYV